MTRRFPLPVFASVAVLAALALSSATLAHAAGNDDLSSQFRTASRCLVCHGKLKTADGKEAPFGLEWGASIMANSARDPYWQGSVRREVADHPKAGAAIQTECATCHMPLQRLEDKAQGHDETDVFKRLPLSAQNTQDDAAADGVTCTVCHQIQSQGLGTPASYDGNFAVAPLATTPRPVFGPYDESPAVTRVHVLTAGYAPIHSAHMSDPALCGSCHTLYTTSYGPDGKPQGRFPEQMTYLEWKHSGYREKETCQQCHMPAVAGKAAVANVIAQPREGVLRHSFVGANFLMLGMLRSHHGDLAVAASPQQLAAAATDTTAFLQSHSAKLSVASAQLSSGKLSFAVRVENLTGHKLPTAFPSRRAWLHVTVAAADGHIVFESGKLNANGSIAGNANDADAARYSPHYSTITSASQVEIFEPILGDSQGHVTTGVLSATHYLKDNRILPAGFDKKTASPDIAVHGKAAADPGFTAGASTTHYAVSTGSAAGPFRITAELEYQPIGYRWAHNLEAYKSGETQAFVRDYQQAAAHSAVVLAHAAAATGK